MKQAVEFAKEILRKEEDIRISKSDSLKRDYRIAINRDRNDLIYYCRCKGLSVRDVYREAQR